MVLCKFQIASKQKQAATIKIVTLYFKGVLHFMEKFSAVVNMFSLSKDYIDFNLLTF